MAPADTRPPRTPYPRRHRRWPWAAAACALAAAALLLALATLGFGRFRGLAEHRLAARLHRRVTIARIERLDAISFAPRIRLVGVRIGQPAWAGAGDMVVLHEAIVRVPVLPALFGRVHPSLLAIDHARVALVHDAGTRANWRPDTSDATRPDATRADLTTILLRDVRFTFDDRRRMLRMAGTVASDGAGVRVRAAGTHRGTPAQAALTGAPVVGGDAGKPWPFRAAFASSLAKLTLDATADRPLDFSRFAGLATVDGDDLDHLDDLLLIGLIPTQPVRGSGRLRRADQRWELTQARATMGRSSLAGALTAEQRDGRWRIDAHVRAATFDFDDLANAAGRARAAATAKRTGPRLIPDTRIDLAKLRTIDGRLDLHVARLLSATPSIFRTLDATAVLDHARLTVAPLAAGLAHGRLEGRGTITHPAGQPLPHLALDLRLVGGRIEDVVTTGQVSGPLRGRAIVGGDGETIRAAVAQGNGSVAMAARGGVVKKTAAEMLGRDLGAAIGLMIGGSASVTPLRCFAARLTGRHGVLTPTLFALDTGVMRADGHGRVDLHGETLALTLDGRSKRPALVRLPAPIEIGGTLSHPLVTMRGGSYRSAGTLLEAIGKAVGGLFKRPAPAVPDADCGALIAEAGV